MPTVARISITPVKALALAHPDEVFLGPGGVPENRRFYLTDRGRLYSGGRYGRLFAVEPSYDAERDRLALRFPDGTVVDGVVETERAVTTNFWGRSVEGHVVRGPWAEALSDYVERSVRLVQTDVPGGGYDVHPATLVSDGSVAELGRRAGVGAVDARRFRMLFDLAGCEPHEEDGWKGRVVTIGEALVRVGGPIERCTVTTRDPDTGVPDLDTLAVIKRYRGMPRGTIDFGVYGTVERPGRVCVGDPVELE